MYLVINHAIRHVLGGRRSFLISSTGWLLTFVAVVVGWVFFRASSFDIAIAVLRAMLGGTYVGTIEGGLLGVSRIMAIDECMLWLFASGAIAFFAPNAYEMIGRGMRYSEEARLNGGKGGLVFGAILVLSFLLLAISETRGVSEFLYFNF